MPVFYVAEKDPRKCAGCGVCDEVAACSSLYVGYEEDCIGCGACALACPNEALKMKERSRREEVWVKVDGEKVFVPEKVTVKRALELLGYKVAKFPGEGDLFAPCEVGGCYSCAIEANGEIKPSCVTEVKEGMEIETGLSDRPPARILHGWMGHPVGGVGTPWYLKGARGYVEAAVFACGCNLRCPQCQNWTTTYCGRGGALKPREAALLMTEIRRRYGVDRMAISGGESTLNRPWLIQYIRELKKLNPDGKARFHVDTNATILTKDYIDALVEAGVTDVGPDLKGLRLETFMKITGLRDAELARKYHQTSWEAVKYLVKNYLGEVFVGIGIPYNKKLISLEEVAEMGEEIRKLDPEVQVCVLDYRPEFRRMDISRPTYNEMVEVWKVLTGVGLRTVICQTELGHVGPKRPIGS